MTIAPPRIALGIKIPNPTMQMHDDNGGPAGWSYPAAGLAQEGIYEVSADGHARAQRFTRTNSGTSTISSGYSPADMAIGSIGLYCYALVYRTPGNTASDTVKIYHAFYDLNGDLLYRIEITPGITGEATDWTLHFDTQSIISGSDQRFHGLEIDFTTNGAGTLDIRFAGLGLYDANDAFFQMSIYPDHPGIFARKEKVDGDQLDYQRSAMGRRFRMSRARNARRFRVGLPFIEVDESEAKVLNWLWEMNNGGNFEESNTNPTGGSYPVLLFPQHDGLPKALYADFEAPSAPMEHAGDRWFDPPIYDGIFEVVEDVS